MTNASSNDRSSNLTRRTVLGGSSALAAAAVLGVADLIFVDDVHAADEDRKSVV